MARDARYDILFEPIQLGPVTARNRFYQVPHCNGMGYRDVSGHAAMRAIKAEGGWAVVCTEQAEIHHSSEITPFVEQRLWSDHDIPALERMVEGVHAFGALAGIELCYNGMNGPNYYTREVPMGPSHLPIATFTNDPVQARAMTKADIANLRRWHKTAVKRSLQAGFDLVYVYAAHGFGTFQHFLSPRFNSRVDEYGGCLENRVRLLREVIEDTREAADGKAAVAVRLAMDEMVGTDGMEHGEVEDMIGLIAELPDLWDLTLGDWDHDSGTARFAEEGAQEHLVKKVKKITSKPVVGVGRFTSPDVMVRQIKSGILDMIGAARPSIADPFLPKKIEEGRIEDIRECIGCNICVASDFVCAPIRCTQNPSMGEEWRKGWHPERIRAKQSETKILIVGGGPAGLEASRALGQRGYEVTLAEAGTELGGRINRECRLPGLSSYARVRDWRIGQLHKYSNVQIYFDSNLTAEDVLGFGFEQVVIATGARWRRDGVARANTRPVPVAEKARVFTPDDLMAGTRPPPGPVVLYDDDHYYMGSVLAELLADEGQEVTLITPAAVAADWAGATMEQAFVQARLLEKGVKIIPHRVLKAVHPGSLDLTCSFTGKIEQLDAPAVVLVTARLPDDGLYQDLVAQEAAWADGGLVGLRAIGDALAPALVAHAVYAGRRYAEEFDAPDRGDGLPFKREVTALAPWEPTRPLD